MNGCERAGALLRVSICGVEDIFRADSKIFAEKCMTREESRKRVVGLREVRAHTHS